MSKKLYALQNLKLFVQPRNSHLCWAACIQMLRHTDSDGQDFIDQNELVKDYRNDQCFLINDEEDYQNNYNIPIYEECIVPFFQKHQILCENHLNKLNNFEFYVKSLNKNKAPLLLALKTSSNMGHLVLVMGYGYCDTTNYLLIFDPGLGTTYFEKFDENNFTFEDYSCVNLWSITFKQTEKIKLKEYDLSVENSFDVPKEVIENSFKEFGIPTFLFNVFPKREQLINNDALIDYYPAIEGKNLSDFGFFKIKKTKRIECANEIYFRSSSTEPIDKTISEEFFQRNVKPFNQKILFLPIYQTKILISNDLDNPEVYPFHFPSDYKIEKKWYSYESFEESMIKFPKAESLKLNNNRKV
ncbi:C39 family peptidase [Aquimarina sp. D1M17]|uniref:C39 family peptidase n=1 Tax=Aquimarina acroporae TaxID=2937283 RepID=UPI0020BFBD34|nr:C39 family peptidase [Aquimarina acroporae]MCK8521973.1 C39 family peptidase [Aquimarina acroporae]